MAAIVAQPAFIGVVTAIVVIWIASDLLLVRFAGRRLDAAGFPLRQGLGQLLAIYITALILISQRRRDELSELRDQLSLEMAVMIEQKVATPNQQSKYACMYDVGPYNAGVNNRRRKTLAAVFTEPVSGSIDWLAIENLLIAVGSRLIEGSGSRVRFECQGIIASFHRPHPAKEAKRYQVRDAREYLTKLGIKP